MLAITLDELIAAMESAATVQTSEGFTKRELMVAMNCCEQICRDRIRVGIGAGVIASGRKRVTGIDGIVRMIPCYVPVKPKAKKHGVSNR